MSFIFGLVMKSITVMTWTPYSIETWRYMSVIIGLISDCLPFSDRDSIESWRDMSVEKPAAFRATHDNDLDTAIDSRLAGYELHEAGCFQSDSR